MLVSLCLSKQRIVYFYLAYLHFLNGDLVLQSGNFKVTISLNIDVFSSFGNVMGKSNLNQTILQISYNFDITVSISSFYYMKGQLLSTLTDSLISSVLPTSHSPSLLGGKGYCCLISRATFFISKISLQYFS